MTKSYGKYLLTFFLSILFVTYSFAQHSANADSLITELNKTQNDSIKLNILSKLFWQYQRSDPDTALILAKQSLGLAQTNNSTFDIAESFRHIGIIKKLQGNYQEAFGLFKESKKYYTQINDSTGILINLTDIADVFYKQNNYLLALEYFNQAMELAQYSNSTDQISKIYHKIGGIYYKQKQYEKALEYHQKSLEINLKTDFKIGISVNYNNIGNAYLDMNQYSKAKDNYLKALEIKKELDDKRGIASALNNIGLIYIRQEDFQKAITYHNQALQGYKELNNQSGIALSMCNLGNDYLKINNLPLAIEYAHKSLRLSQENNSLLLQKKNYWTLSEAYADQNQFKKSREYLHLYMVYNDSIVSTEAIREIAKMEFKYEMEKKEKEIALLSSEKQQQEIEIQKQNLQRKLMNGIIMLVLIVLFFLFWSYRNKQKLNKKLKELNLTKSRFFANISHEFRTPLTLLLGPLEKLLKNPKQEDKEMISLMHRNASRLLFLDNQLMDLAKLESGKLELKVSKADIVQVSKGMALSFESLAKKQQINYQSIFPEDKIEAFFDQEKLEKIICNLISNAIKFTPEKGELIFELTILPDKYKKGLTRLQWKTQGKVARIMVSDTGRGIAKKQQAFVFDRFYQVDSGLNKSFEGTGLGLSLSKELIELHHGVISLESEVGKGSTFTVYLPISKDDFKANEIIETVKEPSGTIAFSNNLQAESKPETQKIKDDLDAEAPDLLQLLIVEDNKDMRTYIRDCFNAQYNILEAADGADGFEIASSTIPDIIITDLMMPKMDGIELCRKLKTDERSSHIPVILLTALSSVEDKILGLETGADDYVAKPFNRQELLTRVQNLTRQRKMLRERFGREIKIQAKDIAVTSADEIFLNKLISYIEKHIGNPDLNVDSLLGEIHLSRSQLHRKLKALTDLSATEFIRNIRLKRAAQLLEQNHGSISQTIYAVGFNSLSYFSKCFQKQFGVSPKEFIERAS